MQTLLILAQAQQPQGGGLGFFLPVIIIMALMYFVMIRPQRRMQKEQQAMRDAMKIGDKVITESGIHGIITGLKDKTASIKIAEGVSVKFERRAIGAVVSSKDKPEAADEDETETTDEAEEKA